MRIHKSQFSSAKKKPLLTSTICQVLSLVRNEDLLSIGWMDEWMNEQINENLASG